MDDPSENGGRGGDGRFIPGNKGGPGNPHVKQVSRWRARFFELVTEEDFDGAYAAMRKGCQAGDAKLLGMFFQYAMGKPVEVVEDEGEDKNFTIRILSGETKDNANPNL